jgi:hypothetical protein
MSADDNRDKPRDQARAQRVAIYADWIAHDTDGLAFNARHPSTHPGWLPTLRVARRRVAQALQQLDAAIRDAETRPERLPHRG